MPLAPYVIFGNNILGKPMIAKMPSYQDKPLVLQLLSNVYSVTVYFPGEMFPTSTQLKYWTFSGTSELNRLRIEANQKHVEKFGTEYDVRLLKFRFLSDNWRHLLIL